MSIKFSNIPTREPATKTKWLFCVQLFIIYFIPYIIVNHLPLHRYTIPFIFGEQLIPFLPWTLVIYFSSYLQSLIAIRYMPKPLLRKAIVVLGSSVILVLLTFIIFPIRFPRELYPTNSSFIKNFHTMDTAGNCFPSLHILLTVVFAFTYSLTEKSRLRRGLMWLWTILITVSVLTTKQHYLIDIFGGIALAIPTIFVLRKYNNRQIAQFDIKHIEKKMSS